ncbi:hypothetical protein DFP73DRAFT_613631 [Morchella snyderi]|nr:hypothetical protein DFP73DRAFT_613631 [Morchella snyderi]
MGHTVTPPTTPKFYVPPRLLNIRLRPRLYSSRLDSTGLFRYQYRLFAAEEYQLDRALVKIGGSLPFRTKLKPAGTDIAGIIVNGKLYVDDEAYWEGLLEEDGEYQVAYVRRPFQKTTLSAWLWHWRHKTPLIDEAAIPPRNPAYKTSIAVARLLACGLIPYTILETTRSCPLWKWQSYIPPWVIEHAEEQERWWDVQRWRMYSRPVEDQFALSVAWPLLEPRANPKFMKTHGIDVYKAPAECPSRWQVPT